jgi:hypothetical protein
MADCGSGNFRANRVVLESSFRFGGAACPFVRGAWSFVRPSSCVLRPGSIARTTDHGPQGRTKDEEPRTKDVSSPVAVLDDPREKSSASRSAADNCDSETALPRVAVPASSRTNAHATESPARIGSRHKRAGDPFGVCYCALGSLGPLFVDEPPSVAMPHAGGHPQVASDP